VNGQTEKQQSAAQRLMGAWRYIGTRINGGNWDRGKNPKGMIYYGPHGEMAVQIAPDVERKRAGAVMTPEEAFIALKGLYRLFRHLHGRQRSRDGDASSCRQFAAGRKRRSGAVL
jgi:hypothetical protein